MNGAEKLAYWIECFVWRMDVDVIQSILWMESCFVSFEGKQCCVFWTSLFYAYIRRIMNSIKIYCAFYLYLTNRKIVQCFLLPVKYILLAITDFTVMIHSKNSLQQHIKLMLLLFKCLDQFTADNWDALGNWEPIQ